MRALPILLFCAVCLAGCNSHDSKPTSSPATEMAGTGGFAVGTSSQLETRQPTRILEEIARSSSEAIPDAVLNRTRCIAIVPSVRKAASAPGVASCRDASMHWGKLMSVTFSGSTEKRSTVDILVFVLSEGGANALRSGRFNFSSKPGSAPGAVVGQMPVVTDAELAHDALTYGHVPGKLFGAPVSGILVTSAAAPATSASKGNLVEATNSSLVESLTSFFNTITPTGIIIHHSSSLPAQDKVPANEQEIDSFHASRGFDIKCFGRDYHVAYHYLIFPNGRIQQGRPERCQGAHALGYNSYLGLSLIGDFSSVDNPTASKGQKRPTARQIRSVIELCTRLMRRYHIPLQRVLRHSDVSSTRCPGDLFPFTEVLQRLPRASY